MRKRLVPAVLVAASLLAGPSLHAHESVVFVTVSQEVFPAICGAGQLFTVKTFHSGTITAIGLDDQLQKWTLTGRSGICNFFGDGVGNWISTSSLSASVLNTYLATSTQFDQLCTVIDNKKFIAETQASGPWNALHSGNPYQRLPCTSYTCE